MSTFTHWVFSDMELDRKFEIAKPYRSVSLGSLEPDQQYPIVHAERLNTRYGLSVLLAILDSPTTSVKVFCRDVMVMWYRMKICKSSNRNVWPCIWFISGRFRNQTPTSWIWIDNRCFYRGYRYYHRM